MQGSSLEAMRPTNLLQTTPIHWRFEEKLRHHAFQGAAVFVDEMMLQRTQNMGTQNDVEQIRQYIFVESAPDYIGLALVQ